MAHIQRLGKDRWQARYREPSGRERAKHFSRKIDAQEWLDIIGRELASGDYADRRRGQTITVEEYATGWMGLQPWRQSTRDASETGLKRILPTLGDRPVASIRTSEIKAWLRGLEHRLAPTTVEGTMRLLAAILRAAQTDRLIPQSPAEGVKLQRQEGTLMVPLTVVEVQALADAAPDGLAAAVVLDANSGLRQGEMFGLTVDRVAWLRRELVVDRQLVSPQRGSPHLGPCKTKRSVRKVPVTDDALAVLSDHIAQCGTGEGGLVFHRDGRPWARKRAAEAFSRLADKAGVEASGWHALRHHTASVLIAQGLSVAAVAAVLGHSPAECLATYAGWWPSENDQVRDALRRAWKPAADSVRSEMPGEGE